MNVRETLYRLISNLNEQQRLFICGAMTIVLAVLLFSPLGWELAFLISWVISGTTYLFLLFFILLNADGPTTKQRASQAEPNRLLLLVVIVVVTLLSIMGVGILVTSIGAHKKGHFVLLLGFLSVAAIMLSWVILHTGFALHYCRLYYDDKDAQGRPFEGGMRTGFIFPDSDEPCYMDFCYTAFTIALTYAISDTDVNRTDMRAVVIVHSFLSFLFYSTVLTIVLNTIMQP